MAQKTVAAPGSSARVFNTFTPHNAIQGAGDKARSLADSLGVAMRVAEPLVKKYNESEVKAGLSARTTGILSDGTKIRNGEMPKDQSSHWMQGYKIGNGRQIAQDAEMRLMTEWETSGIQNSVDPKVYQSWMQDKLQNILSEHGQITDEYTRQGLMESLPNLQRNMNSMQTKAMRTKLDTDTINLLSSDIGHMFNSMSTSSNEFKGVPSGDHISTLKTLVSSKIEENIKLRGLTPDQARDAAFDSWKNEALSRVQGRRTRTDPFSAGEFMELFPKNQRSAKINAEMASVKESLNSAAMKRLNDQETLRDRETDDLADGFITKSLEDPNWLESNEGRTAFAGIVARDSSYATKLKSRFEAGNERIYTNQVGDEAQYVGIYKDQIDAAVEAGMLTNKIVKGAIMSNTIQRKEAISELQEYARTAKQTGPHSKKKIFTDAFSDLKDNFGFNDLDTINKLMLGVSDFKQVTIKASLKAQWRVAKRNIILQVMKDHPGEVTDFNLEAPIAAKVEQLTEIFMKKIKSAGGGQEPRDIPEGGQGSTDAQRELDE